MQNRTAEDRFAPRWTPFEPQRRYGVDGDPTFVRAGDADGDGRTDLLVNISIGPPLGTAVTLRRNLGAVTGVTPYCFCATGAPCGNDDDAGSCANSAGLGASLVGAGSTSVAAADLYLTAGSLAADQFGLFYMEAGQSTLAIGDGMRCVSAGGVGIFRIAV